MSKVLQGVFVAGLLSLSACSHLQTKSTTPDGAEMKPPTLQEKEVSSEDVEKNVEKPYKSSYGEVALDDNDHVEMWIKYFQGKGRKYMESYL